MKCECGNPMHDRAETCLACNIKNIKEKERILKELKNDIFS